MRNEIRTRLLTLVGNRVYEPYAPTKDTVKPYIVIKFGVEVPDNVYYAYRQVIQVWPYVVRGSYTVLDTLKSQIIGALKEPIDTVPLKYEGTVGQDYFDPDWQALTQGLQFSYATIHD